MADIVDPITRSRMMAGIKGKDTRPEHIVRTGLHRLGFRFRLHVRTLPGTPDLVFLRYRSVVEIRGCFWHGHECNLFRWPSTRKVFWEEKIRGNVIRDARNRKQLSDLGWRVIVVWECALKEACKRPENQVVEMIAEWLQADGSVVDDIAGLPHGDGRYQ